MNVIAKVNQIAFHLSVLRNSNDETKIKMPKLDINLKRHLGIDDYSPVDMFHFLPQKIQNLTITLFPMHNNVSGCCFKQNNDYVILINSLHSKGRQNFTLAHELYHLLDSDENLFICSGSNLNEIERMADQFASHFLISEHALYDFIDYNNIQKWTIRDVIDCEQYFQIDHDNMIVRLYSENLITENQFKDFSVNVVEKANRLGYDISLYQSYKSSYSWGHIIPLVFKAHSEKRISKGRKKDILLDLFREDIAY